MERELPNLGVVRISAEPHSDGTTYIVRAKKAVFDTSLICELTKPTGFEEREKEIFSGSVTKIRTPLRTDLVVDVPCREASVCTKYMSLFLKWLDWEYLDLLPKVQDFEEPIEI